MSKVKKQTVVIIVLALALVLAIAVYAVSNYGSQSDPLITKSYLDGVVIPELQAELQAKLDKAVGDLGTGDTGDFSVITLNNGQKVTCGVGCEVMLRIGSAKATGADFPVLVDTTTAGSVSNGAALTANHLYMVTIKGNGFTATSANTKLLISGEYTVE